MKQPITYRFKYHSNTNSVYFSKGDYDTPLFRMDTFKVQEHMLLLLAVKLRNWLNAFNSFPSRSMIDIKLERYKEEIIRNYG